MERENMDKEEVIAKINEATSNANDIINILHNEHNYYRETVVRAMPVMLARYMYDLGADDDKAFKMLDYLSELSKELLKGMIKKRNDSKE